MKKSIKLLICFWVIIILFGYITVIKASSNLKEYTLEQIKKHVEESGNLDQIEDAVIIEWAENPEKLNISLKTFKSMNEKCYKEGTEDEQYDYVKKICEKYKEICKNYSKQEIANKVLTLVAVDNINIDVFGAWIKVYGINIQNVYNCVNGDNVDVAKAKLANGYIRMIEEYDETKIIESIKLIR